MENCMKTKRPATTVAVVFLCLVGLACRPPVRSSAGEATAGIDSLNAALVRAYRTHDPQAYAALYTDTAGFEWPALHTGRGPPPRWKAALPTKKGEHPPLLPSPTYFLFPLLLFKKKKKERR